MKKPSSSTQQKPSGVLTSFSEVLGLRKVLMQAEQLRRSGKLDEAEKLCRKLLSQNPTYMGALQTFGLISIERESYSQAVTCFLTATAEAPDDSTNYLNLAAAWMGLEKPVMAEPMLNKALELDPENAEIHHLIGDVHVRNREHDKAMASFSKAIELDPDHLLSMFKLADTYVNLGFFDDAKDILVPLMKKRPDWIGVINLLHQLPSDMTDIDFEAAIAKAKQQKTETSAEFENSRKFLKASILHRKGEYKEAWKNLIKANQEIYEANKGNVKSSQTLRSRELEAAKRIKISSSSNANSAVVPLFIMGASRSGKTTLEVLLGSHRDVKRGYENHNVQASTIRASQISGLVNIEQLWRLPEQLQSEFSKHFRSQIKKQVDQHRVLTNTSPGLIGSAAQIASALPEARFVFIKRDQNDLALRILMKKYKRANYHSYSLESAIDYIQWYVEMMDLLSEKLGDRVLNLSYEEMMSDKQNALSKTLKLCGLGNLKTELPQIGSDVGCSKPYNEFTQLA
ncbi:MAG: sulfotransferase [Pseudomonadota bacterium]